MPSLSIRNVPSNGINTYTMGPSDGLLSGGLRKEAVPKWIVTPLLVFAWYAANISVLLLNKYLLSYYGFRYPVLLTFCHMSVGSIFGACLAGLRIINAHRIHSRVQLRKILVLATIFTGSVVLGNVSLGRIPVSFNQAIGATTPLFTAVLSFLIEKKVEAPMTYCALVPVVCGIIIVSGFELSFNLLGFLACLSAAGLRAFKTVAQSVLLADTERMDSMNLLMYMSPASSIMLLLAAVLLEPGSFSITVQYAMTRYGFVALLLLNCTAAYLANLLNFVVTKHTSALSLQVLGNAKGFVAAIVSVLVFKNPMSWVGMFGYAVTIGGVVWYSESKKRCRPRYGVLATPKAHSHL